MSSEKETLSLAQQNLGNSPTFINNLSFLIKNNCDIFAVSEPPKNIANLCNAYPTFCSPSSRTAIIVLNPYLNVIHNTDSSNAYVTSVFLPEHKVTVKSIYWPPHTSRHAATGGSSVIATVSVHSSRTFILGDFNAKHETLGDPTDARGALLMGLIEQYHWKLLNQPGIPTRKADVAGTPHAIDWSLCSADADWVTYWSIPKSLVSSSDHHLIIVKTNLDQPHPVTEQTPSYIDLRSFLKHFAETSSDFVADNFISFIQNAVNASLVPCRTRYKQEFFNLHCIESKKHVRRILRKIKRHGRTDNLIAELKDANLLHQKNVSDAKESHWINELKRCRHLSDVQKFIKLNKIRSPPVTSINSDTGTIIDPESVAEVTLKHFFPSTSGDVNITLTDLKSAGNRDHSLTQVEVDSALSEQNSNTPGPDKVNLIVIRALHKVLPHMLLKLFNDWFYKEKLPQEMKCATITLLKKDSNTSNFLTNLRPIALVSIFVKIYERIVAGRIRHFLHTSSPISDEQFGFRSGSCCEDALICLHEARKTLSSRDTLIALDVKGAFNNVSHRSIIQRCKAIGLSRSYINILIDYLSDRRMFLSFCSNRFVIMSRGVPQGTVLGPLLFVILFDVFIENLKKLFLMAKLDIKIIAYADDVTLVVPQPASMTGFDSFLGWIISNCNTILANIGLTLNLHKTQVITNFSLQMRIGSQNIIASTRGEILGIDFQSNRSHLPHINKQVSLVGNTVESLRSYISTSQISVKARIALVNSSIVSKLCYGAPITFGSTSLTSQTVDSILAVDRDIAAKMFGTTYHISYAATIILRGRNSLLYAALAAVHRQEIRLMNQQFPIRERRLVMAPRKHPSLRSYISFSQFELQSAVIHPPCTRLCFYTDGSKVKDAYATSCAVVILDENDNHKETLTFKLPGSSSAYQCERHAVMKAVLYIYEICPEGTYHILTDSLSLLRTLAKPFHRDTIVASIADWIYDCSNQRKHVYFSWVKGHSDIIGNILADEACHAARNSYDVEENMLLPAYTAKAEVFLRTDRQYAALINDKLASASTNSLITSFEEVVRIHPEISYWTAPFYSNTAPTRAHLKRLGVVDSELCDCGKPQTVLHCFLECKIFLSLVRTQFCNSKLSTFLASPRSIGDVISSHVFHNFIASVAKDLLRWLESVNNIKYTDLFHHCFVNQDKKRSSSSKNSPSKRMKS